MNYTYTAVIAIYLLFLVAFGFYSFFALRQVKHFGYIGDRSQLAMAIYIVTDMTIIILSFIYLIFIS